MKDQKLPVLELEEAILDVIEKDPSNSTSKIALQFKVSAKPFGKF